MPGRVRAARGERRRARRMVWKKAKRGGEGARRDEPARFMRPLLGRNRLALFRDCGLGQCPLNPRLRPSRRHYRALQATRGEGLFASAPRRRPSMPAAGQGAGAGAGMKPSAQGPSDDSDRAFERPPSVKHFRHNRAGRALRFGVCRRRARSRRRAGAARRPPSPASDHPRRPCARVSRCPCGRGRCSWRAPSAWRRSWRRPSDSRSAGPTWRGIPPASARIWCRDGASAT